MEPQSIFTLPVPIPSSLAQQSRSRPYAGKVSSWYRRNRNAFRDTKTRRQVIWHPRSRIAIGSCRDRFGARVRTRSPTPQAITRTEGVFANLLDRGAAVGPEIDVGKSNACTRRPTWANDLDRRTLKAVCCCARPVL